MHNISVPDNITVINMVRKYPEGKSFYCCLCDVTIGCFPNFKCHYTNIHKDISINVSAKCTLCQKNFKSAQEAGVHCKRTHKTGSKAPFPLSPTPIMLQIPVDDEVNFSMSLPRHSRRLSVNQLCTVLVPDFNDNPVNINQSIFSPPSTSQFLPTIPSSPSSMRCPQPSLINLNNDEDPSPSTPPRPSSPLNHSSLPHQTPQTFSLPDTTLNGNNDLSNTNPSITSFHQTSTESGVAFIGGTANSSRVPPVGDTEKDDTMVNGSPPSNIPSVNHSPIHQSNPEPSVVLNNCTDGNGDNLPSSNNTSNNTSNTDHVNEKESEFVCEWHNRITSATTFVKFSRSCDLFAAEVATKGKEISRNNPIRGRPIPNPRNRPNGRVPFSNCRPLQFNPRDAKRIQILYRLSKKTAARQILNKNNTSYSGTKECAEQYFSDTFSPSTINLDEVIASLNQHVPYTNEDPSIMAPITNKEIKKKLCSMSNSAPGRDKVEYRHLKLVDPNCKILGAIFNKCLKENKIPASWKQSTTILIHKKVLLMTQAILDLLR